ncbi:hypothetical protein ABW19_dt0207446 [Dactylella cylindrospora]|nr:hypothetical protein ABW19_dt0207446 [Dactylella cylindrospora]
MTFHSPEHGRSISLKRLLGEGELTDVRVIAGPAGQEESFDLHRVVLAEYTFFKEKLNGNKRGRSGEKLEIKIPTVSARFFKDVVAYIYENKLGFSRLNFDWEVTRFIEAGRIKLGYIQISALEFFERYSFQSIVIEPHKSGTVARVADTLTVKEAKNCLLNINRLYLAMNEGTLDNDDVSKAWNDSKHTICWNLLKVTPTKAILEIREAADWMHKSLVADIDQILSTTVPRKIDVPIHNPSSGR